jgi:DNA-binding transcriptional regulator YhcF (GntR family)
MAQQLANRTAIAIERDEGLPVAVQLAWRIQAMIAGGRLAAGEPLPSVRELAKRAAVNVNTVRSVYRRLERDGWIVSRQGLGTFVAEGAASSIDLERIVAEAVSEARDAGVDPRALVPALYAAAGGAQGVAKLEGTGRGVSEVGASEELAVPVGAGREPPSRFSTTPLPDLERHGDERDARRELRRQIERLEAELAGYTRDLPAEEPPHPLLAPKAHVANVSELEAVRDRLLDRLADARATTARRATRQERARAHRERMAREPERHKWEWISNEEAGEPGCATWHVRPRYGPLGALMGWWRVKVSSGCPLAAPREAAMRSDLGER